MTGRYHLMLSLDGRPAMHGWWASDAIPRRKLKSWIGEHGRPGVRITLIDEETGETLTEWPDVVDGGE